MFLVIAATAAACYGTVYAARLFKLRKEVARNLYLPPENHLSWTAEPWHGSIPVAQTPSHALAGCAMDGPVAQLAYESDGRTQWDALVRKQELSRLALVGAGID
ncbi:MAG TPA: hypothetical protein GX506_01900, partial [Firmicutes bacterium]|nr:hypothetical protein [Bacillota bacterium]